MAAALSPLAHFILDAADKACSEFVTEEDFFRTFDSAVLARTDDREAGIASAIAEIVGAGLWPWRRT